MSLRRCESTPTRTLRLTTELQPPHSLQLCRERRWVFVVPVKSWSKVRVWYDFRVAGCLRSIVFLIWKLQYGSSIAPVLLSSLERLVLALPCVILRLCGRRIVSVKRRPVELEGLACKHDVGFGDDRFGAVSVCTTSGSRTVSCER